MILQTPADILIRLEPRLAEFWSRTEINILSLSPAWLSQPVDQLAAQLLCAGRVRQQEARIEQ